LIEDSTTVSRYGGTDIPSLLLAITTILWLEELEYAVISGISNVPYIPVYAVKSFITVVPSNVTVIEYF
jgi:hypothetical protein